MARQFVATSNQYLTVPDGTPVNPAASAFTFAYWVRFPTTPGVEAAIFTKRTWNAGSGFEFKYISAANQLYFDLQSSPNPRMRIIAAPSTLFDGNWHLIIVDRTPGTVGAGSINLYLDNVSLGSTTGTNGDLSNALPLRFAADNAGGRNVDCDVELGGMFKRVLTVDERAALQGGFVPVLVRGTVSFSMQVTGRRSPEIDIVGGSFGTLVNAPVWAPGPKIIYPQSGQVGQDLWYEYANATISGQSALDVTQTRGRIVNATIAGQSALTADISANVAVSATIAGQSVLTADISPEVISGATISGQSVITATVNIDAAIGAEILAESSVQAGLTADVPVQSTVGGQSALTAAATAAAPVDVQIDGQSALTVTGDRIRTLSTTIGGQSALTAAVTITAGVAAQIDAQSSVTAATTATAPVGSTLAGQSGVIATLTANVPVITTLAGASGVTAAVTRGRQVQSTIAGMSTVVADIGPLVPVETTIAGQSSVSATSSATVSLQVGIDAESTVRARPTYPGEKKTITVGGAARFVDTVGGVVRWLTGAGGTFTR